MGYKILIVAPDNIFRTGMVHILMKYSKASVIDCCESEEKFINDYFHLNPNVCIIDYEYFGRACLKYFLFLDSLRSSKFVFIIGKPNDYDFFLVKSLNAHGLISKDVCGNDFCTLLMKVIKESKFVSNLLKFDNFELLIETLKKKIKINPNTSTLLTRMELNIFSDYGNGFSTYSIAKKRNLSKETINTHRRKINQKLGINNMDDFLLNAKHFTNIFENNSPNKYY